MDVEPYPKKEHRLEADEICQAILASIQDGISVLDADLTIRFTNAVMERWYHHQMPLQGKKCYEAYHSARQACSDCPTMRCLETRQVEKEIVPGPPLPDAPVRWLELYSYPIMLDGEIIGVAEVFRDVTERELAQQELKETWDRLRQFLDASPDLCFMKDVLGRYLFVNAANAAFFGRSEKEILGKTDFDLMPTREIAEGCTKSDQAALAEMATVLSIETAGEKTYECRKFPIVSQGKLLGIGGIARDITEQIAAREREQQLERRMRLAQRMEAIGRLAGGIAHDFNNMLAVIIAYAQLALNFEQVNEPLRGYIQQILGAAEKSREITQQLLAFASRQQVQPQVVDLNQTIEEILKLLRRLIGENIELVWKPCTQNPTIKIDPSQVHQILTNLCVNARDAIEEHGSIIIETDTRYLDNAYCDARAWPAPGEYAVLVITDTGKGIPSDHLDHIFEPFFTTKGAGEGVGLGLATVYGIVKQNNGFINVYSEVGRGTAFKIYLPLTTETFRHDEEPQGPPLPLGKGECILVVEDEPALLKLCERLLTTLGYKAICAATPTEAMRYAAQTTESIDLLITDVLLPEMNGRELASRLLDMHPKLKCLFMSGYTENVISHRGIIEAGYHFIAKPFSVHEFGAKVRQMLEGSPS